MRVVALTGAGISVASGLPTYTEASREKFSNLGTNEQMMALYWDDLMQWLNAQPNRAHLALAEHGVWVVTQNIDNLHQRAGSKRLIELHGNLREFYCAQCGHLLETRPARGNYPTCPLDGTRLRPNIVFYGESVHRFDEAMQWVLRSDHLLVIGTSLTVFPAAGLVGLAQRRGVPVTVINQDADVVVPEVLERIKRGVRA